MKFGKKKQSFQESHTATAAIYSIGSHNKFACYVKYIYIECLKVPRKWFDKHWPEQVCFLMESHNIPFVRSQRRKKTTFNISKQNSADRRFFFVVSTCLHAFKNEFDFLNYQVSDTYLINVTIHSSVQVFETHFNQNIMRFRQQKFKMLKIKNKKWKK